MQLFIGTKQVKAIWTLMTGVLLGERIIEGGDQNVSE